MGGKGPWPWHGRQTWLCCRSLQVVDQLVAGSLAAPHLHRGDKTPQPPPRCAGSAKPLPPFWGLLRDGAEGEGIKKNMLKLSKQTPSTPIDWHQGWGDKAQCWICSWCKPNTNRVKRRKSGRTCNPLSYNVDSKLGIRVRGWKLSDKRVLTIPLWDIPLIRIYSLNFAPL